MRVLFPKGEQNKFINKILSEISVADFAKICNISERTVRDWRREKFLVDLGSLKKVLNKIDIKIPKNTEIKDPFWYVHKGAKIGGKLGSEACFKKHGYYGGDPEYRKKRWYEWWEKEGKYKSNIIGVVKPIKKPGFSKELAEFVGIVLGDGGITRSQITITTHSIDDKDYSVFFINLAKKLFKVHVGVHYRKDSLAMSSVISRTELVKYCVENLGLKIGNKVRQQVDIPDWIKKNKSYSIACVRGLIDTDGCVFNYRYKVKGKQYNYKKLSFTNYSRPLLKSVFKILKNNKLNPRVAREVDVRLDSVRDMKRYFDVFSSNNPKHLNKYHK